jgi:hypothetical protein
MRCAAIPETNFRELTTSGWSTRGPPKQLNSLGHSWRKVRPKSRLRACRAVAGAPAVYVRLDGSSFWSPPCVSGADASSGRSAMSADALRRVAFVYPGGPLRRRRSCQRIRSLRHADAIRARVGGVQEALATCPMYGYTAISPARRRRCGRVFLASKSRLAFEPTRDATWAGGHAALTRHPWPSRLRSATIAVGCTATK